MNDIIVLLLAGGKSSRFWPLTNKMSVSFLGKSFIDHQIELLIHCGFMSIVVVGSVELKNNITDKQVRFIIQQGEGQAGAILSAGEFIKSKPVLIVNADDLVSPKLYKKLRTVINSNHHLLVGYKTQHYFPGGYLVMEGKKVARIVEKPGEGMEPGNFVKLVSDYFTNSDILLEYIKKEEENNPLSHYENSLSSMIGSGEQFEMMEYSDTWLPLKFPWQTLNLMKFYLESIRKKTIHPTAKVHKTAIIEGLVILGEGVRVLEYAKLVGPLYIGKNSIIGNHTLVRESMIGENCVIGFNTEITRSFIGNNCWFHTNYIGDSVIDEDVAIGAGSVLANLRLDENTIFSCVSGEKISTHRNKLGAIIGRGSRIGIEAQLMPGIKVGADSVVGPGVVLQEDLDEGKKCILKQDLQITDVASLKKTNRDQFRKTA